MIEVEQVRRLPKAEVHVHLEGCFERAAIEQALERLSTMREIAYRQRAEAEYERRGDEWRELIRDTAIAICRLQALNRRRLQLSKEIKGGRVSALTLPLEFAGDWHLLGLGSDVKTTVNDGSHNFIRDALKLGIVTQGEIDRERNAMEVQL